MAISPPLLRAENLTLTFGGKPLFEDVSFSVHAGDRIALVGRNGSGKSTLLKIASGLAEASTGEVITERNATIRYLPQDPDLSGFATIGDYARADLGPLDDPFRADYLLGELGLDPDRAPQGLSGGEMRRAALARTLAPEPDILFLDEPTNHLDLPAIEWLENELSRSRSAIVLISHDRRFLEKLSRRTLWLDRGTLRENNASFAEFEDWRDKVLEEEEREHHKLGRKIVREEHWVTHGVSGRRKRNMRRLGELSELRKAFREHQKPEGAAKLAAADTRESGKLVIEATGIAKSFGERALVKDFSLRVHRGDRIGLVGPNGAGKTTLVKLLTGELTPDEGTLRLGANLDMAMVDQRRDALNPDETLEHFLTDGRGQSLDCQWRTEARRLLHEGLPVQCGTGAHTGPRAVGRRESTPDPRPHACSSGEPACPRRTDQRSRHGNARPAARADRGFSGYGAAGQPRPRLSSTVPSMP
jgi:ATP-binding cassette subfamily F protein uup